MADTLDSLVSIIASGVENLKLAYSEKGESLPSLDDTFLPSALDHDAKAVGARRLIIAAAAQLLSTVRFPVETLQERASEMHMSAALSLVVDFDVVDIIKEGGAKGVHVNEIAAQSGIDSSYVARILRYLATRHIFREITPNIFANNRLSSLLLKTKSREEVKAEPVAKFDGAQLAAYVSFWADTGLKSSAHWASFIQNAEGASAPFNIAFGTTAKMWDWFNEPGNEFHSRRFIAAMAGSSDRFPSEIFVSGIDGNLLNKNDIVVDVGGNVGSVALVLFKAYPHLRYVVQDLDRQIEAAQEYWNNNAPEAAASGQVQLQVHDFFTPQPVKNAAIYFIRTVVNDWPDADAKKILINLRNAASSSSKLVIFDRLSTYSCYDPSSHTTSPNEVPSPLLSNLGIAGAGFTSDLDMLMFSLFNGKERTEVEFKELGEAAGWKLEKVTPGPLATLVFSAA